MNVNQKGVKGLLKVMQDLHEKGFYTFTAFDDHSPIDLIAVNKQGVCYRLQIKYREKDPKKKSEKYILSATSVVNGKKIPIDRNMIDGWAVYLLNCDKVVYIKKQFLENKTSLTINPETDFGDLDEWFKSASC